MIQILLRLLAAALALYLLCLVALVVFQRRLMYFPDGPTGPPSAWGLTKAEALQLRTDDGETLVAWYQAPAAGKPLFLYFHGNGGTLPIRADLLRRLVADGSGLLAIDYRGYGGSTGRPSEPGLLADGRAAYAAARARGVPADRIVVIGESLGSAVAVAVAADNEVQALVLDSAFSSTAGVAAAHYWMFPVRLLMRDTYRSSERIGRVTAPKLFLHGEDDNIVPIAFGRALFAAAHQPKTFVALPGRGHIVLWKDATIAIMRAWLGDSAVRAPPSPR